MKKNIVLIILTILGLYWLLDHKAPLPFNHESLGLYNHEVHALIGVILLIAAGIFWKKWIPKKER